MAGSSLTYRILGDPSSAIKAMHRTRAEVDKSTKGIRSSFKKLAGLSAGISLAGFAKSAFDEARESQKVSAQTGAVLKSTGGAAKISAGQVGDLANAISKKSGIDDEAIQSGENMLLTFTDIRNEVGKGKDIFNQATQAITDMSVATGQSMTGSAVMLGKALNDPIKGISKLTKIGVTFTQQQKDQIAAMAAAGDTAGAQKVILDELGREFGGSAAAQATAADKAKVAFGNLEEQVGTALIPALDTFANVMSDDVVPALSATFGWLDKHRTEVKIVAGAVLGLWGAYKGYTIIKSVVAWTTLAGARYRQYVAELSYGNRVQRIASSGMQTLGGSFRATATAAQASATTTVIAQREVAAASTTTTRTVMANNASIVRSAKLGGVALGGLAIAGSIAASVPDQMNVTDQIVGYTKLHGAISDSAKAFFDWISANKKNASALKSTWVFDAPALIDKVNGKLGPLEQAIGGSDAAWAKFKKTQLHGFNGDQLAYLDEFHKRWKDTAVAVDGATGAAKKHVTAEQRQKAAVDATNKAIRKQKADMDALLQSILEASGNKIAAAQAELQFRDGLAAAKQQVKDNGKALDANTAKGRANREWLLEQVSAINDVANAQSAAKVPAKEVAARWAENVRQLRAAATAAGLNKTQVDNLVGSMTAAARRKFRLKLDADLSSAQQKLRDWKRYWEALRITLHASVTTGTKLNDPRLNDGGHWRGTNAAPAGWAWVGERGPELMRFKGGEQVLSHPNSMALASAGGYAHGTTTLAALAGGGLRVAGGRVEIGRDAAGNLEAWVRDIVLDEADHSATIGRMRR